MSDPVIANPPYVLGVDLAHGPDAYGAVLVNGHHRQRMLVDFRLDSVRGSILAPVEEPEDPVRLRGSLCAMQHVFRFEAGRMRALVARYVRAGVRDTSSLEGHRVGRALSHDRRFELDEGDVELAWRAGGARAVYELWTGESGVWAEPPRQKIGLGNEAFAHSVSTFGLNAGKSYAALAAAKTIRLEVDANRGAPRSAFEAELAGLPR